MAPLKDIVVPELGMTTEEVTIESWLKAVGDPIKRGEPIVDLVTDKASMELEATDDGVLAEILVGPGTTIPVRTAVGRLDLGTGEDAGPEESPVLLNPEGPAPDAAPPSAPARTNGGEKVRATPVARRIAREHGLELSAIAGSGPHGRIRRADVEAAVGSPAPAPAPAPVAEPARRPSGGRRSGQRVALSVAQRRLAAHLTANNVPQFGVARSIDLTAPLGVPRVSGSPTFSDVLIKAVAMTLRHHERLNATYEGDDLMVWDDINVGMAVAAGSDLFVPVVRNADKLRLAEISEQRKALTARAMEGSLGPQDTADATFVISNMGTLGATEAHVVVSPPQVCILGVGAPVDTVVPVPGGIATRRIAHFRTTCDHRAVNGSTAAAFLEDLAARLANPFTLGEA